MAESADRDADADADVDVEGEGGGEGKGEKEEKFQDEIENGVHQLETLLEATVDKTFDRFEIFTLRNILTVPDDLIGWMRLAHYEVCWFFVLFFPVASQERAWKEEGGGRGKSKRLEGVSIQPIIEFAG